MLSLLPTLCIMRKLESATKFKLDKFLSSLFILCQSILFLDLVIRQVRTIINLLTKSAISASVFSRAFQFPPPWFKISVS